MFFSFDLHIQKTATSKIHQRIKAFDRCILEIIEIHGAVDYFICYTSTESVICSHNTDSTTLKIEHRFFKTIAIKSILMKLLIKKIVTHTTADGKLTIVVLLNDDSLYIYEVVNLNKIDSWSNSIKLIKHIHPIERLDSHFEHSDPNNSEFNGGFINCHDYVYKFHF